MNLPNKLTLLRVILIPFFVVFLLTDFVPYHYLIALVIFIVASLTDMADGKIARKYNLITNFGKFMDPLADKLLVCSAMICLIPLGKLPAWVVIVMILELQFPVLHLLGVILMYVALGLTIVSLIDYLYKNRQVLKEQK